MGKRNQMWGGSRLVASVLTASMIFSMLPMGGAFLASAEGGSSTPIRYEIENLIAENKLEMHNVVTGTQVEAVASDT